jgi:hypothetical protein
MKRNFKQWWSTIPPISTKRAITSHLYSPNIKKTTIYNVGYTGPGLEQAPKCGGVNIYIIMWSCPGNMPKYYPGLRDILPSPICHNITQVWETYYPPWYATILPRSSSVLLFHYYAMRWSCIISIIIFRVSFCSDIWYCNILAYYLDN